MIHVAGLNPQVTFAQGAEFVRVFGGEDMAAINQIEQPMVYAEAVSSLNPRRPTAEEKAAAQLEGGDGELIRHQLTEKRRGWGNGYEDMIHGIAEVMGLSAVESAFEAQSDGNPTEYGHVTAIEGANDQTYLRASYAVDAQKAGLITIDNLTVVGTDRIAGNNETFAGMSGFNIADHAVKRLAEENPGLFSAVTAGAIAINALHARTRMANTRQVLRESWLQADPHQLSEERVGVSTSRLYNTFMGHDAAAVALELGVPLENIYMAGVPAPATVRRNHATYGAEISQALVSAAYHQQAINIYQK
jgi:hypothetical protein